MNAQSHSVASGASRHVSHEHAVVGPNAILQLFAALQADCGSAVGSRVMATAGLGHYVAAPPTKLVSEIEAARLFAATRATLPTDEADSVLAAAGYQTADYIVANRIPRAARAALGIMPTWVAARLFLAAIKAHAWTFAGSGTVTIEVGRHLRMTIKDNPLATPGCPWHVAVLQRLFQTTSAPRARVTHERRGTADIFRIEPSA